jgi:hypothetical protein
MTTVRGMSATKSQITDFLARRFPQDGVAPDNFSDLLSTYVDSGLAPPNLVQEITCGDDGKLWAHVWEALLYRHLLACGYKFLRDRVKKSGQIGPDFGIVHDGQTIWYLQIYRIYLQGQIYRIYRAAIYRDRIRIAVFRDPTESSRSSRRELPRPRRHTQCRRRRLPNAGTWRRGRRLGQKSAFKPLKPLRRGPERARASNPVAAPLRSTADPAISPWRPLRFEPAAGAARPPCSEIARLRVPSPLAGVRRTFGSLRGGRRSRPDEGASEARRLDEVSGDRRSHRASRDPPHPALADARATFPRKGGRRARPFNLADARRSIATGRPLPSHPLPPAAAA